MLCAVQGARQTDFIITKSGSSNNIGRRIFGRKIVSRKIAGRKMRGRKIIGKKINGKKMGGRKMGGRLDDWSIGEGDMSSVGGLFRALGDAVRATRQAVSTRGGPKEEGRGRSCATSQQLV